MVVVGAQMKPVVHALCLLIGLGLVGGVGAQQGETGPREVAPPVAEAPPRPAVGDQRTSEPAGNAGAYLAPASAPPAAPADAVVPARQAEKPAEAQPGAPRDSLWLLLLQLLRSPR
jgi:hypothetical protein